VSTGATNPTPEPAVRPSLDLNAVVSNPGLLDTLKFSRPESIEEQEHRLSREWWTMVMQNIREIVLILCTVAGLVVFCWVCIEIIRNPTASADDKKWATSIITLFAGALVGYLTGKNSK
jgi:hypothetical protein